MGEVYKARDSRLDRDVAVKVIAAELSASSEQRQRFEREARTISQLSHPHICALFDVGEQESRAFLVMELLQGETLAERLAKGPLPIEQTLRCGVQIAEALDKAHRQGIVHRDLKPGNIMLTKSGVKLLDFGLAKAVQPVAATGRSAVVTTPAQHALTEAGMFVGTPQYMSPEQITGGAADARSDIFALGTVLYEMVTGARAFAGSSRVALASSILNGSRRRCRRSGRRCRQYSIGWSRGVWPRIQRIAGSTRTTWPCSSARCRRCRREAASRQASPRVAQAAAASPWCHGLPRRRRRRSP